MKKTLRRWWEWVKVILSKLLHRDRHVAARAVRIYPRYPNMPKRQPCPNGHGLKRRLGKTLGGAQYECNRCGNFFVKREG